MNSVEVTSLSSKGQVVIPNIIRNTMHLKTGAKLIILTDGKNILLKPVNIPNINEFENLLSKSRQIAKSKKLTSKDLKKAIKKVRSESNN